MKFELEKFNQNITNDEIVADIQRVATELKQNFLTISQYEEFGKFDPSTPKRRFGSWSKALIAAGLTKSKKQENSKVEDENLFQNLEEVWIKLGRQPRQSEMSEYFSKYGVAPYKRRFGSWMKALESFVAYVNTTEDVSFEKNSGNLDITTRHRTQRNINWRLRFIVMKKDNFKCKNCGRSPATDQSIILHVDHIKAWTNGGETVLENLQTLCSVCNIGKSDLE